MSSSTKRNKNAKPENDFHGSLKAKKALIEEINEYVLSGDTADRDAARAFADKWQGIGFVPFKEKEAYIPGRLHRGYAGQVPGFLTQGSETGCRQQWQERWILRKPLGKKDRLVQQYNKLQQDIDTYENNIGFFSSSKSSAPLIQKMQERIDAAKRELKDLEAKRSARRRRKRK